MSVHYLIKLSSSIWAAHADDELYNKKMQQEIIDKLTIYNDISNARDYLLYAIKCVAYTTVIDYYIDKIENINDIAIEIRNIVQWQYLQHHGRILKYYIPLSKINDISYNEQLYNQANNLIQYYASTFNINLINASDFFADHDITYTNKGVSLQFVLYTCIRLYSRIEENIDGYLRFIISQRVPLDVKYAYNCGRYTQELPIPILFAMQIHSKIQLIKLLKEYWWDQEYIFISESDDNTTLSGNIEVFLNWLYQLHKESIITEYARIFDINIIYNSKKRKTSLLY